MLRSPRPAPAPSAPEPLLRRLIGASLRRRRRGQGRTLQDVASSARISTAYLSEVERGRKEASSEVLLAVCRALRIRLVDLLAETTTDLLLAEQASRPGALVHRIASPTSAGLASPVEPTALVTQAAPVADRLQGLLSAA